MFAWSHDPLVTIEHVSRLVIHDVLLIHGPSPWNLSACPHRGEGQQGLRNELHKIEE